MLETQHPEVTNPLTADDLISYISKGRIILATFDSKELGLLRDPDLLLSIIEKTTDKSKLIDLAKALFSSSQEIMGAFPSNQNNVHTQANLSSLGSSGINQSDTASGIVGTFIDAYNMILSYFENRQAYDGDNSVSALSHDLTPLEKFVASAGHSRLEAR